MTPEGPETPPRRESRLSRLSSITLMVAILVVAAMLSALTAMRFAIRGHEVVVPDLAGKTEDEARQLLSKNALLLRVVDSKRFSTEVPEGHIVEQIPAKGTRLKTSRSVKVLLSQGQRKYPVPNLKGTSLRATTQILQQINFRLGNTAYAHTSEGEPQTVVLQFPPPGSEQGTDPSVNILISLGPS